MPVDDNRKVINGVFNGAGQCLKSTSVNTGGVVDMNEGVQQSSTNFKLTRVTKPTPIVSEPISEDELRNSINELEVANLTLHFS